MGKHRRSVFKFAYWKRYYGSRASASGVNHDRAIYGSSQVLPFEVKLDRSHQQHMATALCHSGCLQCQLVCISLIVISLIAGVVDGLREVQHQRELHAVLDYLSTHTPLPILLLSHQRFLKHAMLGNCSFVNVNMIY